MLTLEKFLLLGKSRGTNSLGTKEGAHSFILNEVYFNFRDYLVWFFLMAITSSWGQRHELRENYGVDFREVGIVEFVHDAWHHTFAINFTFPEIPEMPFPCGTNGEGSDEWMPPSFGGRGFPLPTSSPTTDGPIPVRLLELVCPLINDEKKMHSMIKRRMMELQDEFDLLIPDAVSPRRARGLFNIVGEVSKSLFGTATTKDRDVLSRHIAEISSTSVSNEDRINSLEDTLGSFLKKRSLHDRLVENGIALVEDYANLTARRLHQQVLDAKQEVAEVMNLVHLLELHYVDALRDMYEEMKTQMEGIHELMKGYLPRNLISVTELKTTMTHIENGLRASNARLTHTNHIYYYHVNDVVFTRQGNMLYVKMKFPITRSDALFRLYSARAMPLPLDSTPLQYSMLKLDFRYIALTDDETTYSLLTDTDYELCAGSEFRRCDSLYRTYSRSTPTCLYALFKDDSESVNELCESVVTTEPKDFVIRLGNGDYYISSGDTAWTQRCASGKTTNVTACRHCVMALPCHCSLRGTHIRIPLRLDGCLNFTTSTITHGVNLPSLLAFYGDSSQIISIAANQRFVRPVRVDIPRIDLVEDQYRDVVAKLKTEDVSLRDMANFAKHHRRVYASPTAKLRSELGIFADTPPESLFGISGLSLLVAFLALFLALRNARVVMLASGAAGLVLPRATEPPTSPDDRPISFTSELVTISIWSCLFLFLILGLAVFSCVLGKRVMEACFRQPPNLLPIHSTLQLVFYCKGRYAMADLLVFPGDIKLLRISQRGPYKPPTVEALTFGAAFRVTFDWSYLDLIAEDGKRLALPRTVRFSSLVTRNLRGILSNPEEMKIIGCYQGSFFDLFQWKKPEARPLQNLERVNPSFQLDAEALEKMAAATTVV